MIIALCAIFVFFVAADQLTKHLAVEMLQYVGNTREFIPGFLRFEYCQNTGMAWGALSGQTIYLTIVSLLLMAMLIYLLVRYFKLMPNLIKVSLVIIIAGAAGNLIDRLFLNYVRDFLAFDFMSFPVFNVADSCVTIGVVLLVVALFILKSGREFLSAVDAEDKLRSEQRRARRKGNPDGKN